MDTVEICSKLEDATYLILGFLGEENISTGTGVAFNARGDLLTAAHVVTGRLPVRREDLADPRFVIQARRKKGGQFIQYMPVLVGITVSLEYFKEPLTIDIAVLRANSSLTEQPFLPLARKLASIGTRVLMAGFSDEMKLPLSFDCVLDYRNPEVQAQMQNLEIARKNLLMIKSGMIGCRYDVHLTSTSGVELTGAVYWVDNALHNGASGGSVVNSDAEIIGILTERAITPLASRDAPSLEVPSGSNVAVSPSFILPLLESWRDEPTSAER